MRLLLLGCALLTACIQSELVPCGDQLCARGSMCIGGSICANADQLSACSGAGDGEACTLVSGTVGRCTMGVCVPSGCGNDRLDPGEVCDDGNVTAGDGCSGTCDSDETCGNGVLDVVKGESCDCGDGQPGHTPATCVTANSDDPASPCSADCKLRRCGDGIVAGPEQCDGTIINGTDVSCSRFGFYSGTVSCSPLCQFDPRDCTERCGDGIIQTAHEVCDGKEPEDTSCLDFGYDLGWLGCTDLCNAELVNCDRLGWSRIHPRVFQATDVITRAGRVLIRFSDSKVSLLVDGVANDPAGTFDAIAGTPTTAYAVSQTLAAVFGASAWQPLPTVPWSSSPRSAWASDTLGLFAIESNNAKVYRFYAGAWSTLTLPSQLSLGTFGRSRDKLFVFDRASNVAYEWTGSQFTLITAPVNTTSVRDIANAGQITYMVTEDGLFSRTQVASSWNTEAYVGKEVVSNSLGGVDVLTTNNQIVRIGAGGASFDAPPFTSIIDEDQGAMYVAGPPGGVFGVVKGAWQALPDPSDQTSYLHIHGGAFKPDSVVVAGAISAFRDPGRDWQLLPSEADTRDAITTPIGTATVETKQISVRSATKASYPLGSVDPYVVWEDGVNHKIYVAGDNGMATFDENTQAIVETIRQVRLRAISGTAATNLVTAGGDMATGAGVIYQNTAVGWVQVDTGITLKAINDVYIAGDGTITAIGGDSIYTGKVGTPSPWKVTTIPGATLVAVSGTSAVDIFVTGVPSFGFPFSGLAHYDGTHLYSVRLPSAAIPHGVFATRGAIYVLQANASPPTDSIYQLVRTTIW